MCHLLRLYLYLFFFQVATQPSFCPSNPGRYRKSAVDEFENISSLLKCYEESVLAMKSKFFRCEIAESDILTLSLIYLFELDLRALREKHQREKLVKN